MSSISAQGVVERASAELSKRINGLGLRSKHHHGNSSNSSSGSGNNSSSNNSNNTSGGGGGGGGSSSNSSNSSSSTNSTSSSASTSSSSTGKTSVMERVTNALCGGNSSSNNSNSNSNTTNSNLSNSNNSTSTTAVGSAATTPDKPSRAGTLGSTQTLVSSNTTIQQQQQQQQHTTVTVSSYQMLQKSQQHQQQQQHQQYLSSQIANSTLINSNLMNSSSASPPAVPGIPMGAPPAPSVTSIAKQMNITIPGSPQFTTMGMAAAQKSQSATPLQMRKQLPNPHMHHPYAGAGSAATQLAQAVTQSSLILPKLPPPITSIEILMMDDRFLNKFFLYFSSYERRVLAQVCTKWRDVLYRSPRYWSGLLPTLQCRELRQMSASDRVKLFNTLIRRGFHALALVGANDDDAYDVVHSFALASKHIHSLSLRCSSISDRGLEALLDHLQSLFELELAGCNEVTEAGLWACLTPRIVSLSLADCINIADEAVGAVAQLLPSLYEFSLQAYHVTDAALGYFSPKQSHSLSILRLQSCWELTNHGIVNIVHSLPHLTVLSLSGCSKLTDDGVELIAENLQKLRALDLSWCPRITDASLEYIACDLNQLEELTLDRCVHITDIGVGYISTMLSLTALFLRWCSQVRDFGLQHLCSMRNLQVLSLAGCPLLTSSGLSSLIQLRHLQELELTNCPGASQELFEYLKDHLPRCLIIE
ncbi:F-box/LRR-repeat protein 16 [Lucilia sericata]|uniref:F-box/LRR-repeat protein 16 n=1 Tax=Lucilia sericata TaxID=13632 RepID=UPI0018A88310|nr:F-box/LRR-repeat protein 16 [Lucilia sericata]XP_037806301.1 F-box/LRR-repeat protein 16 [Lucilia sericata]XP_037806302.1 F-box/LRR-repeat protein 16 [Lucilia sericata]